MLSPSARSSLLLRIKEIVSDRGKEFLNETMKKLFEMCVIKKMTRILEGLCLTNSLLFFFS